MSRLIKDFNLKFKTKELLIYESKYWIWSLRPNQVTLGTGLLSLKRECADFSGLIQEEFCDLKNIIQVIERTLMITFNYNILNYLMLMMVDKQVHYHVIPRYESDIDFGGILWKDSAWPAVPDLTGDNSSMQVLYEIQKTIKENLNAYGYTSVMREELF
jgi:diadenosine tetraphosphate (Ap4A) HIT family hydrolase